MSRFVRPSKYRHVFGRPTKKEQCYDNLHISRNAWDSNIIKANPTYLSVNWEAGGGGAFAVIPLESRGRLPEQLPLFRGHTAAVLDTDWSPFNDSLIASGSDDGKVFIWTVPKDFTVHVEEEAGSKDVSPVNKLLGHSRKVGHVMFHPVAENVLATSSGDFTIKLWDVETGQARLTQTHNDLVQSMSFSGNGSLMVTTCRDKKLRVWDLRQEKPVQEVPGHAGAKNSRTVWLGDLDRVATTGFSKMSDRQLGLWDIRQPETPIGGFQTLDSISGVCMPFWDDGTKCLYLAGKGDGNIRYFEYANDDFIFLSEYKSAEPQRGLAFLPKRGVAVHDNEVMRAFKTVNDSYIEPISFIVPRRAETFQSDIFPEAPSGQAGLTASGWFDGEDANVPTFDLAKLYDGDGAGVTITKAFAPSAAPPQSEPPRTTAASSSSISKASQPTAVGVATSAIRDTVNQVTTKASEAVEAITAKIQSEPVEEPKKTLSRETSNVENSANEPRFTSPMEPPLEKDASSSQTPSQTSFLSHKPKYGLQETDASTSIKQETSTTGSNAVQDQLSSIKDILEKQTRILAMQDQKMTSMLIEMENLKAKLEEGKNKDETIRRLELQLEEARS